MSHDHAFSIEHDHVEALLAEHAIGTGDPSDRSRIDAHLAECAACRATFAELGDVIAGLEQAVRMPELELEPRAHARESLIAAARRTPQVEGRGVAVAGAAAASATRRSKPWRRWLPIAAPTLASVALVAIVFGQAGKIDTLERDLDTARGDQVPVLKGASVNRFEIGGAFDGTSAGVVLKRDAGIVTFRKVPAPPGGMAWHVWAVDGDEHIVPIGMIDGARDLAILPIEGIDPKDVQRIIVTTESVEAVDPAGEPDEDDAVAEATV